ncbi:MAG TPA: ABC transporter permease subunit [Thermoguttaceae bacterium]|nr:ABC transporter permease subunit [Thermoguttaceae bacterium]
MLKQLAIKELRETAWIGLAALALYLYFFMTVTGVGRGDAEAWRSFAFVANSGQSMSMGGLIGLALAIGLGLRQTVGESTRGTFQFLLHRPASRRRVIGTKLLVGMAFYLCLAVVPSLLIVWWATTPGNLPAPFEWSMLGGDWRAWLATTVLYLAAFLSGLRPARWRGTRLLPAAAGVVAVAIFCFAPLPYWWATGLSAIVAIDVLLVGNIFYVAQTRDFS